MPRRKRLPFNSHGADYAPAPVLVVAAEALDALTLEPESPARRAAREPARVPLPPLEPPPLSTLELAFALDEDFIYPFLARSIELAGGFRPILERAGLSCDSAER